MELLGTADKDSNQGPAGRKRAEGQWVSAPLPWPSFPRCQGNPPTRAQQEQRAAPSPLTRSSSTLPCPRGEVTSGAQGRFQQNGHHRAEIVTAQLRSSSSRRLSGPIDGERMSRAQRRQKPSSRRPPGLDPKRKPGRPRRAASATIAQAHSFRRVRGAGRVRNERWVPPPRPGSCHVSGETGVT